VRKTVVLLAVVAALALVIVQFPYGRLFPWSPVKPGYSEIKFAKVALIVPRGVLLTEELAGLDQIVADVESFHRLEFKKTVRIILARTGSDFWRFTGRKNTVLHSSRSGTVVAVSRASLRSKGNDITDLLKRGLASALLIQNTSLFGRSMLPKWIIKGLPLYYGMAGSDDGQREFLDLAAGKGYYFDVLGADYQVRKIPALHRDTFVLMEYRFFLEYIADTYGNDKLIEYVGRLLAEPGLAGPLFYEVFEIYLGYVAEDFRQAVLSRNLP
jgi:hypothetical protein